MDTGDIQSEYLNVKTGFEVSVYWRERGSAVV